MNNKKIKLPPIYKRNGKDCYLDPIRKKLIYITPEETVRQMVISYLINVLEVPADLIVVEEHLSHYGINTNKRADIIIHTIDKENNQRPIAVIECKAPNVYLDVKAQDQMLEYCDMLEADYAMMVNTVDKEQCFVYDYEKKSYVVIDELPCYKNMCDGNFNELDVFGLPPRIKFSELQFNLQDEYNTYDEDIYISRLTPMNIAVPMYNLLEGLLDTRVKMPIGNYGLFELIEDYGVRMISYGNASGGKFFGPYRSFLVKVGENTEFYSISITTYCKSTNPEKVKTCICVAHDDEKESHHALQLVADDNLVVDGDNIDFYHNGRIAIGNIGSGKIDELRSFVIERYPQIVLGKSFFLGRLVHNRLWQLDDPEIINLIVNLISYAMIRDEYRDYVKSKKNVLK
ncbi:MAG: type I restriction enzyme HsdR N-terminal domain-containing protein [Lachnospiraceae bacterium]|nr:type I restriction enzyme HsdR N-terminal domain-containing protein [Lachnospiraceae bacterium]